MNITRGQVGIAKNATNSVESGRLIFVQNFIDDSLTRIDKSIIIHGDIFDDIPNLMDGVIPIAGKFNEDDVTRAEAYQTFNSDDGFIDLLEGYVTFSNGPAYLWNTWLDPYTRIVLDPIQFVGIGNAIVVYAEYPVGHGIIGWNYDNTDYGLSSAYSGLDDVNGYYFNIPTGTSGTIHKLIAKFR